MMHDDLCGRCAGVQQRIAEIVIDCQLQRSLLEQDIVLPERVVAQRTTDIAAMKYRDKGSAKFLPLQHASHAQAIVAEMGDDHIEILELLRKKDVECGRNLVPEDCWQVSKNRAQRRQTTPPANRVFRQRLPILCSSTALLQGILVTDNAHLDSLAREIHLPDPK